jgi:hypothetical protein
MNAYESFVQKTRVNLSLAVSPLRGGIRDTIAMDRAWTLVHLAKFMLKLSEATRGASDLTGVYEDLA